MRPRPLVLTVSWMDESVCFMLWDVREALPRLLRERVLSDMDFDTDAYRHVVCGLTADVVGHLVATRWIAFEEALPRRADAVDSKHLSPSMAACCGALPLSHLPTELLSASSLIEGGVYSCHDFGADGTGFCGRFGNRLLFIAKGNSERFTRLSRPQFSSKRGLFELSADWMRQTVTLFRNRTGIGLKRIRFSWRESSELESGALSVPFEMGWVPVDWPSVEAKAESRGIRYLHQLAAGALRRSVTRIGVVELEKRRNFWRWERRLRIVTTLLMCGWVFLVFGACRHHLPESEADGHLYSAQKAALSAYQADWMAFNAVRERQVGPFWLVGQMANLLPRAASGRQLTVSRSAKVPGAYVVRTSGYLEGDAEPKVMDAFVASLRGSPLHSKISHIKFQREEGRLFYEVEAVTSGKWRATR